MIKIDKQKTISLPISKTDSIKELEKYPLYALEIARQLKKKVLGVSSIDENISKMGALKKTDY